MKLRYLENVTTLKLDVDKCVACGRCVQVCPHGIFQINGKKAEIIDRDACMECGACAKNCAPGAISVRPGVGCAMAIIIGAIRGSEPTCDCSEGSNATCC